MNDSPRRSLSLGRRIGFTALAFLFFLALVEAGLWFAAVTVGPQSRLPEGEEIPTPAPDAIRVIAVGDSWVYGAESEPEEAFIEVFRRRVEAATGKPVQVYNLGVSASNSAQALVRLHATIEAVGPSYVVALTGANNLLHDTAVADAAALMGQDARMVPGLTWLSGLRTVRGARLIWINLGDHGGRAEATPGPARAPALLAMAGGTDPTGSTGLPKPPVIDPIPTYDGMPWWQAFERRQWEIGLSLVGSATPPTGTDAERGLLAAWEALFLAHLDRFEEAETKAATALRFGGDPAVAHEARAVSAERRNREIEALQHRIRAADSGETGHPWVAARARALVLMDLEMWEPALAWLLPVLDASRGNLEAITALARLPSAARTPAVEEHLSKGPRNSGIRQAEYFEWHRVSSGMLDRMTASLGTPDPGEVEPFDLRLARARLLELTDGAAAPAFRALIDAAELPRDRARAYAGLVRAAGVPDDVEPPPLDGVVAAALVAMHRDAERCDEALRVGQAGLAAGLSAVDFELAAGSCLSREVGWSLTEQALGRGPVLDRVALVLGLPAGGVRGPVPPPDVPFWPVFRERRFDVLLTSPSLPPAWRALVLAHLERPAEALTAAADPGAAAHPSARALARAMAAEQRGDFRTALIQRVVAAEATRGDTWLRYLARGTAQAHARRWKAAQRDLLGVLQAAPGYLEALEVLAEVPEQVRFGATQTVLRWTPSGSVPRHRWSRWYASQGRSFETEFALRWPEDLVPATPQEAAETLFARARLAYDEGRDDEGAAGLASATAAFAAIDRPDRVCVVRTFALDRRPDDATDDELEALASDCSDHPAAMELAGRLATRKSNCNKANVWARTALEAGADPSEMLAWVDPCTPSEAFEGWVEAMMKRPGTPPLAAAFMAERLHPQEEKDAVPVGRSAAGDLLVSHLDAMARLSRAQGAEFLALTYPFPGAHHVRVRDILVAAGAGADLPVLDLYGHFQATYTEAAWQAMRTPQDHVNARGYATMGDQLFRAWFSGTPPP